MGIDISDNFRRVSNNFVDLSNTNANVNLDMTFEVLYFNNIVLSNCNLSNTDIKINLDFSLVSLVPKMMIGKWKGCFVMAIDTRKKIKGKSK